MRQKLQRFMIGRYGVDELGRFLMYFIIGLFVVSMIASRFWAGAAYLYWIGFALMAWSYVRMFSRDIQKRYAQNQKFLNLRYKAVAKFSIWKKHIRESKTHRFFKCPNCKQKVRVPKGKGKICITCPSCRTEFVKRS